jgi:hypothetical protein
MSVTRSNANHETRYELDDNGQLACVLTYTADPSQPATWKLLLPGDGGYEDLYGTAQFPSPDAGQLEGWLKPVIGGDRATELAQAVEAQPPRPAGWQSQGEDDDQNA